MVFLFGIGKMFLFFWWSFLIIYSPIEGILNDSLATIEDTLINFQNATWEISLRVTGLKLICSELSSNVTLQEIIFPTTLLWLKVFKGIKQFSAAWVHRF